MLSHSSDPLRAPLSAYHLRETTASGMPVHRAYYDARSPPAGAVGALCAWQLIHKVTEGSAA